MSIENEYIFKKIEKDAEDINRILDSVGEMEETIEEHETRLDEHDTEIESLENVKLEGEVVSTVGGGYASDSVLRYTAQTLTEAQQKQAWENLGIDPELYNSQYVYGVQWGYNNASPELTRIGNLELHKTLPIQNLMKRCILSDSGEVVYYLDPNDSTKKADGTQADLSGAVGQVMVEIPEYYRRFTLAGDVYRCEISLRPFQGAHKVKKSYIGAYEAALDRTALKLGSFVNMGEQYRGGNNTASWDGTYRSLLGKPATSINLTNFRTYGRNRGTGWGIQSTDTYQNFVWLYYIEYANLNSQDTFYSGTDSWGYRKGGLGPGVTNISNWAGYNSYNPVIPCGATNSLGNRTGIVTYNVLGSDGTSTYYAAPVPSYRGIENPFGHVWKWTDGFLGLGNGSTQDYYTCHDPEKFASVIGEGYTKIGTSQTSSGWAKKILFNSYGDLLCTMVGGSDKTYLCDYNYISVSNNVTYGLYVGGSSLHGAAAGFAYFNSINGPSYADAYIGSRLCWLGSGSAVEEI